jgi:2-polyprenyl-3-methyl-5-hydroxy-6-metoxy-1,4-benzoquinol methylase
MKDRLRRLKRWLQGVAALGDLPRTAAQGDYLQRELERLRAVNRMREFRTGDTPAEDAGQTKASFDFQWQHMAAGKALPTDAAFMADVARDLVAMVGQPAEWFAGKRVADIGCGIGRYSHGLLQLGAHVTACDQSTAALQRTGELCRQFNDRLSLKQVDLLEWDEAGEFDLAFSFGVVHHTGNTYRAIRNVARKVRPGGRLFLMVYSVPQDLHAYRDVNQYERIADENRALSFAERREDMIRRFGEDRAHGWFDATSPRINDRLTFDELHELLGGLGFANITGRIVLRDHYIVADRID